MVLVPCLDTCEYIILLFRCGNYLQNINTRAANNLKTLSQENYNK